MNDAPSLIDMAHAAMQAAPENDTLRLRFFERVADSELVLALAAEATDDTLDPLRFDLEEGPMMLAFDSEARLTQFMGKAAPYAAMPGRRLVRMLAGQGISLGLNLEVAPSAIVLPADALEWLDQTLAARPTLVDARPTDIGPPKGLPEAILGALDAKLARAVGLARTAYLVQATYETGGTAPLLVFVDALPAAQETLAEATQEALTFAGLDAGLIDVTFLPAQDPLCAALARHGLRFDLPKPAQPTGPAAPGMDPDAPPKLR